MAARDDKRHLYIGIDPDAVKSGVAALDLRSHELILQTLSFPDLLDYLMEHRDNDVEIYIEAGWLNETSNYHGYHFDRRGERIARDVGRNQETGHKITEMCNHWNIPVKEVAPLPLKCGSFWLWKGKDGKITHDEIVAVTGVKAKRTNQEERDAALLVWVNAGLPVKAWNQR